MQRKPVYWILEFTSKLSDDEKVKCLQANSGVAPVLKYCFDPKAEWLLPETDPPYTPCEYANLDNEFWSQLKKLYLFVRGGNDELHQIKRERIFIDILETIHPEDAKLLCAIKNKKLPWPEITSEIVLKAFPGLY